MLKANIKLPLWLGLIALLLSGLFSSFDFNPLVIIIYVGTLYLIIYFIFGYIKRKDALVIDQDFIKVRSPFKYNEWEIKDIKNVYIGDNGSMLKAIIIEDDKEVEITLCTNIYDKNITEILKTITDNQKELSQ